MNTTTTATAATTFAASSRSPTVGVHSPTTSPEAFNPKRITLLKLKQQASQKFKFVEAPADHQTAWMVVAEWTTKLKATAKFMRNHLEAQQKHFTLVKENMDASAELATGMNRLFDQPEAHILEKEACSMARLYLVETNECNKASGDIFDLYNKTVIESIEKWLSDYAIITSQTVAAVRQQQLLSEHYTKKVTKLKVGGQMRRVQHRQTPKMDERIQRNELKKTRARTEYVTALGDLVALLKDHEKKKYATMAQVAKGHAEFQKGIHTKRG
jgi:hypothetical protein